MKFIKCSDRLPFNDYLKLADVIFRRIDKVPIINIDRFTSAGIFYKNKYQSDTLLPLSEIEWLDEQSPSTPINNETLKGRLNFIRNNLYEGLPTGKIGAFELTALIKKHLEQLDNFIDKDLSTPIEAKPILDKQIIDLNGEVYLHRDYVEDVFVSQFIKNLLDKGKIKIVEGQEDYFKTNKGVATDLFKEYLSPIIQVYHNQFTPSVEGGRSAEKENYVGKVLAGMFPCHAPQKSYLDVVYALKSAMIFADKLPHGAALSGQLVDVACLIWDYERLRLLSERDAMEQYNQSPAPLQSIEGYIPVDVSSGELPEIDKDAPTTTIEVPIIYPNEVYGSGYYDLGVKKWIKDNSNFEIIAWLKKITLPVSVEGYSVEDARKIFDAGYAYSENCGRIGKPIAIDFDTFISSLPTPSKVKGEGKDTAIGLLHGFVNAYEVLNYNINPDIIQRAKKYLEGKEDKQ